MKMKELMNLERIKRNAKENHTIPSWTMTSITWVALLNVYYGHKSIDLVYVLILMCGSMVHERKIGKLETIPKWLYYTIQSFLILFIILFLAHSLIGEEIDKWFMRMGW